MRIAPLASTAASLFLLPPQLQINVFNGTAFQGASTFGFNIPPDLAAYLGLSSEQLERARAAYQDYQRFYTQRLSRAALVTAELDTEFGSELLVPQNLGERYVELETLRREVLERESSLRTELRAIMSPTQRTLLESLEAAQTQQQIASTANSYRILSPQSRRPASNSLFISNLRLSTLSLGSAFLQVIYRSCGGDVTPNILLLLGGFGPGDPQSMRQ